MSVFLATMIIETCAFETDRLSVRPWHSPADDNWPKLDLARVVAETLTEPVTRYLPGAWQGSYSLERATAWIGERDDESPTLLAVERQTKEPVGVVVLVASPIAAERLWDVRLGYFLAETAWGKGLAGELLGGFVGWCEQQPAIGSITGGVAAANEASQRVLERVGFSSVDAHGQPEDELIYQLRFRQ